MLKKLVVLSGIRGAGQDEAVQSLLNQHGSRKLLVGPAWSDSLLTSNPSLFTIYEATLANFLVSKVKTVMVWHQAPWDLQAEVAAQRGWEYDTEAMEPLIKQLMEAQATRGLDIVFQTFTARKQPLTFRNHSKWFQEQAEREQLVEDVAVLNNLTAFLPAISSLFPTCKLTNERSEK